MQRLFIGIPVPAIVQRSLVPLQPRSGNTIRPVSPAQMHLTLQFIGQAEPEPIARALYDVCREAFSLGFDRIGSFGSTRRDGILWVGLQDHPLLLDLHSAISGKLEQLGFLLETRAFTPHITLARYRRSAPAIQIKEYLQQVLPPLPELPVTEFILYSSEQTQTGATYARQCVYPLRGQR